MKARDLGKKIADYFNLQSEAEDLSGYNYAVSAAKPKGVGANLKAYFDLQSHCRAGNKVAIDVMALANAEGVSHGRYIPGSTLSPFSYRENDFEVKLEGDGRVLLKCDAAFAEKVGKLASVGAVTEINKPAAPPAPQVDAPKP